MLLWGTHEKGVWQPGPACAAWVLRLAFCSSPPAPRELHGAWASIRLWRSTWESSLLPCVSIAARESACWRPGLAWRAAQPAAPNPSTCVLRHRRLRPVAWRAVPCAAVGGAAGCCAQRPRRGVGRGAGGHGGAPGGWVVEKGGGPPVVAAVACWRRAGGPGMGAEGGCLLRHVHVRPGAMCGMWAPATFVHVHCKRHRA